MLITVGRDPNDQYFPLAFAIVETETKVSWRWFLTLVLKTLVMYRATNESSFLINRSFIGIDPYF